MARGKSIAGVAACTLALVGVLHAAPAFADDQPHFFNNDPSVGWAKGCVVTYSLTRQAEEYAPYVKAAYAAISGPTNFMFTRVPAGDTPAGIRISVNRKMPGGADGWGSTVGTLQLSPIAKLPDWGSNGTNDNLRTNLIAHETMHVLGLDHDMDETEVMYPVLPTGPLAFGASDLAGLSALRTLNHCTSPGVQDPAFIGAPLTDTADTLTKAPSAKVVSKRMPKARCVTVHGQWIGSTRTCRYLKYH